MSRNARLLVVGVLLTVGLFILVLRLQPGGPQVGRAIDDVGQLLAAAVAAAAAGWRARRSPPEAARSWLFLALATGSWALGETAWSYYELIADRQTPFPSVADAGFLMFAGLAVVGLLLWPSAALHGGARWRTLLDGVLVAGALFIVSWVTALGSVVRGGGDSWFAYAVSLAYPVSDLVVITLSIIVVAQARRVSGSGLGLLALGLGALCLADTGFAYLTAADGYQTGSWVDAGWFGGFLLIAAAAVTSSSTPASSTGQAQVVGSTRAALLPYVPAGLGLAVYATGQFTGDRDRVALIAAMLVMAALLVRQLLAVLENRRLVRQLVNAQHALRHQAFHDPLTGLANRALFADRLRHSLQLHKRDLRQVSLLYCDLDGLKTVNDTLGHDAGDAVIKAAAERLLAVTRPGDTVARMGGDEFAVLLEDGGEAVMVAARIIEAFTQPASVGRHSVPLSTSIGIAELTPSETAVSQEVLLQRADAAMYQAKRAGRGTAVAWTEQLQSAEPRVRHRSNQSATIAASPARTTGRS